MYRDEADILPWSLEHWYRLGVRDFYLCDNLSTDGSALVCERFKEWHPAATVWMFEDDRNDWPGRDRINTMKTQAIIDGCDWIFPADADEFLELPADYYNIEQFLSDLNPNGGHCAYELQYLNILPNGRKFWQQPQKKVFGRLNPDWTISMGNHLIENRQPDILTGKCGQSYYRYGHAYYRHYSIRSFDQFKRKMINWWTAFHNSPHQTHPHAEHYRQWQIEGDAYIQKVYDEWTTKSW
jgi:hypothetical protein